MEALFEKMMADPEMWDFTSKWETVLGSHELGFDCRPSAIMGHK